MTDQAADDIFVVAVAVIRGDQLLMVRKRTGGTLILPGGKTEQGERQEQTVRREVIEELGCRLTALCALGEFTDASAHDTGRRVRLSLYIGQLVGQPKPAREIAECRWVPLSQRRDLAPIHAQINPALLAWLTGQQAVREQANYGSDSSTQEV